MAELCARCIDKDGLLKPCAKHKRAPRQKRKIKVVCGKRSRTYTISGDPKRLTIFKLGDAKSKWVPNRSHFEAFNQSLREALSQPEGVIVFHYGVTVEQVTL